MSICGKMKPGAGLVVFDIGNVLLRWEPRAAFRHALASDAEIDALFKEHDLPGNSVVDIDSLHLHPQVIAGESIIQRDLAILGILHILESQAQSRRETGE